MNPRNVGEAILVRLKFLGVDRFFANPGTEFVSVIRGFQDLPKETVPIPVMAPHEFLAVSMAYGYFLATKRPQAVMTHANVGAANALIGLIGAARMNVPLIFIAGLTSRSERQTTGHRDKLIHWAQDARDPGAMYREYVKWEVEISDPSSVFDIIDRAYAIATSAPSGPVAIKISRDILMSADIPDAPARPTVCAQAASAPDSEATKQASAWLKSSEKPLIVTNRLGVDPSAVSWLRQISEEHAIGVLAPEDFYMSFPTDHPHHLGFRQSRALSEADLVLVIDTEAPWYPLESGPAPGAKIVHVGGDPLFSAIPLRSHRGDAFVQSSPSAFLAGLTPEGSNLNLLSGRRAWIQSHKRTPPNPIRDERLNAQSISSVLSEFLEGNTILINELGLDPELLRCRYPGNYFRSGSASPLGWGVGCALGLSLADRKKTVIAAVGDGVFYLSPVLAALLVSARQDAPFITLVVNNGGMASISQATRSFYPEMPEELPLTSFHCDGVSPESCAALVSGLGLRAESQSELREALKNALKFCVVKKRPVIINAVCAGS